MELCYPFAEADSLIRRLEKSIALHSMIL